MLTAAATEAIKALPAEKPAVGVQIVKDEADHPFKNAGEFFQAVKAAGIYPQSEDPRLRPLKATGMSEGIPADGGYLLEESYASGLLERMYGTGSLLNMLPTYSVGPNSNSMTFHGVDETSRALGSRWGALRGYWLAEADTITASRPKFRDVVVKLNKVAALVYATDEQLEDSTFLASWLGRTVPNELRFRVEDSVINGDGSGKPLGVLNSPCLVSITQETSQPADTLYYENIVKMWARRWAGVNDYVWLCNQDVMPALDTLSLAVGTGGLPANYITYSNDGVMRIKGRPVMEVEYCATLGDVGDIILFSPSSYLALVKGGVQAASSIHVSFTAAETAFRFIYRFGGQPSWDSTLTPAVGSNTQSPFVVTETR
jgi:HK97 family phage major capsid protein